jgi:transposase
VYSPLAATVAVEDHPAHGGSGHVQRRLDQFGVVVGAHGVVTQAARRLVHERPDDLPAEHRSHLDDLLAVCPHLATLAQRVREFADILTHRRGPDLDAWITTVDNDDLPALVAFIHGLRMDPPAVVAGLSTPYSNGPIEGANTIKVAWNHAVG